MAVKEAEDDENIDEDEVLPLKVTKKTSQTKNKKQTKNKLSWVGEPIKVCTVSSLNERLNVCAQD